MSVTKETKQEIISKFGKNDKDSCAAETQIALLTTRIQDLTEHLKSHPKDHSSRRGLLKLVGQRRRMLKYLQKNDLMKYRELIKELGLRK